ncbi:hypothetical protein DVDV_2040 [Desulfovibrio sp. DV]|uniref:hypothetical protein n=1 Tax=Desulfovibrio sp. DV TaxID=1844708 RepID=UPI000958F1C2|nr:hypothetical protein [Desulfovibrio sp. DV]OLN27626.1 hypothetical protein DVDV_2040 [Desulfovibrio sp. DV]
MQQKRHLAVVNRFFECNMGRPPSPFGHRVPAKKIKNKQVVIIVGSINSSKHDIFLKFLATQGFFEYYSKISTKIIEYCSGKEIEYISNSDKNKLLQKLMSITHTIGVNSSVLIQAKMFDLRKNKQQDYISEVIESVIEEAKKVSESSGMIKNTYAKERILQKIRKILYEAFKNVYSHAYGNGEKNVAIYSRIRIARPKNKNERVAWDEINTFETNHIPAISNFEHAEGVNWVELYISDCGKGIKSNTSNSRNINNYLHSFSSMQLIDFINNNYISASDAEILDDRSQEARFIPGGLKQVYSMLSIDKDYVRIGSNNEWAGLVHKYVNSSSQKMNGQIKQYSDNYFCIANKGHTPGLSYCFNLYVRSEKFFFDKQKWIKISDKSGKTILTQLKSNYYASNCSSVKFYDYIFDNSCSYPQDNFEGLSVNTTILRPPRHLYKEDLIFWVLGFINKRSVDLTCMNDSLVICDMSPFQALIALQQLQQLFIDNKNSCRIFLLTRNWHVCCLKKDKEDRRLLLDIGASKRFFDNQECFSIAEIVALKLRYEDSLKFWKDIGEDFISEKITWLEGDKKYVVDGYISIEKIMANTSKRYIAYRALQRCLYLFDSVNIFFSDSLIKSIYIELKSKRFSQVEHAKNVVLLGSVVVSNKTIKNTAKRLGVNKYAALPLMTHKYVYNENGSQLTQSENLNALLWLGNKAVDDKVSMIRIRDTPFISQLGNKDITFDQCQCEVARSKRDMYQDFEMLDCVRIGHYVNNKRHDLIALNTAVAYMRAAFNSDSIIDWLYSVLRKYSKKNKTCLLVYFSHYAIDRMVRSLKSNNKFKAILDSYVLLPVSFF